MPYFRRFPLMAYDIKGNKQYKLLPDILRRVKLRTGIRNGSFLFDKYNVKQGEKPEDIAFKWFGDAEYHWIILMTNNVTDRYYQWPMTQPQFEEFLKDKYGAGSEDGIHHYEITQQPVPHLESGLHQPYPAYWNLVYQNYIPETSSQGWQSACMERLDR